MTKKETEKFFKSAEVDLKTNTLAVPFDLTSEQLTAAQRGQHGKLQEKKT